jgi:hypothetical protein
MATKLFTRYVSVKRRQQETLQQNIVKGSCVLRERESWRESWRERERVNVDLATCGVNKLCIIGNAIVYCVLHLALHSE